ncbi:hypothetical protein [Salibacterium aidingense]|uniref:hypothetical protein n=1 Tax=Salibacterium aidingense TaxID=384933 RepID=UPI00040D96F5|nr:hypothetical protein [Salibacterium aidingense]
MENVYLQVRIDKDLKERFSAAAKKNGTDASALVRSWVTEYVREMELNDVDRTEQINNLYDAGYKLKKAIDNKNKVKKEAWELNNLTSSNLSKFMEKVMTLYTQYEVSMPQEILEARQHSELAQALVMGMLGEERT